VRDALIGALALVAAPFLLAFTDDRTAAAVLVAIGVLELL